RCRGGLAVLDHADRAAAVQLCQGGEERGLRQGPDLRPVHHDPVLMRGWAGLCRLWVPAVVALLVAGAPLGAQEPGSARPIPRTGDAPPAQPVPDAPGLNDAASDLAGPAATLPATNATDGAPQADARLRLAPSAGGPGA